MQWELIERAKEELGILETYHPNKYECLKMDLKTFISDFELQLNSSISMPYAATQESSSNRKKRKKGGSVGSYGGGMINKRRCKTDAVLEKAQQCLHKIQHLKTSLHNNY